MSRDSVTGAAVLEFTINSCLYIKKQFGSKVFLMISRYHFNVLLPRNTCRPKRGAILHVSRYSGFLTYLLDLEQSVLIDTLFVV